MSITLDDVLNVLGKPVDAPEVTALLARAGKVAIKPDFVIAKAVGLEFALRHEEGQKKKVLHTAFLKPKSGKEPGFEGLTPPFAFTTRQQLHASAGLPTTSFILGKGDVSPSSQGVHRDTWERSGVLVAAKYAKDESVTSFFVTKANSAPQKLAAAPLGHVSEPVDAPAHARRLGQALLLAWAAHRFGLPPTLASHPSATRFLDRRCSPVTFVEQACPSGLDTSHVDPRLADFLRRYVSRLLSGVDDGAREAFDDIIVKLLRLTRTDQRCFTDDYLATFSTLDSPFFVPDDWSAVDAFGAVLDARWADYEETKFERPGTRAHYEKAAARRDAVTLVPSRRAIEAATVDSRLAADLISCIDKPLTDKQVKAVLTRATLPIGKRIDEQANPALGVAYLGSKFPIGGKQTLGVSEVSFWSAGVSRYVRGLGKEVTFAPFAGPIHQGVSLGMKRDAVRQCLGAPTKSTDDADVWKLETRRIRVTYSGGVAASFSIGRPVVS